MIRDLLSKVGEIRLKYIVYGLLGIVLLKILLILGEDYMLAVVFILFVLGSIRGIGDMISGSLDEIIEKTRNRFIKLLESSKVSLKQFKELLLTMYGTSGVIVNVVRYVDSKLVEVEKKREKEFWMLMKTIGLYQMELVYREEMSLKRGLYMLRVKEVIEEVSRKMLMSKGGVNIVETERSIRGVCRNEKVWNEEIYALSILLKRLKLWEKQLGSYIFIRVMLIRS